MAEHVVVPIERCDWWWGDTALTTAEECRPRRTRGDQCLGCLGDGTRALLDQAKPLRRLTVHLWTTESER